MKASEVVYEAACCLPDCKERQPLLDVATVLRHWERGTGPWTDGMLTSVETRRVMAQVLALDIETLQLVRQIALAAEAGPEG